MAKQQLAWACLGVSYQGCRNPGKALQRNSKQGRRVEVQKNIPCLTHQAPKEYSGLFQVRTASCGALNCVNTFGDEQLAVDVLADKLLFEALKYSVLAQFLQLALQAGGSAVERLQPGRIGIQAHTMRSIRQPCHNIWCLQAEQLTPAGIYKQLFLILPHLPCS